MAREIRWLATARRERAKERKTKEGWMSRARGREAGRSPVVGSGREGRNEDAVKMKFYCPSLAHSLSHTAAVAAAPPYYRREEIHPIRAANRFPGARTAAAKRLPREKVFARLGETKRRCRRPPRLFALHPTDPSLTGLQ